MSARTCGVRWRPGGVSATIAARWAKFFVGGDAEGLERVKPVLESLGSVIHHVGSSGRGMAIKLAINALFAVQVEALAEVMTITRAAHIPDEVALTLLGDAPVASPALRGAAMLLSSRAFDPLFPVELVAKDLGYALDASDQPGPGLPVVGAAKAAYTRACEAGLAGENLIAVAKLLEPNV